jgi:hypothetical protein
MVLPFYIHPSNRLTSTFFEYPASSLNIPKILREKTVPSRATTILTCVSIRATSTRSQAPVMSELWYWNICHVNCQVCCAFIQKLPCTDPRSCSNPSRTVACFHCWFVNKPLLAETIRREIPGTANEMKEVMQKTFVGRRTRLSECFTGLSRCRYKHPSIKRGPWTQGRCGDNQGSARGTRKRSVFLVILGGSSWNSKV